MIDKNNNDWEKWLHKTLRSLPDKPAPRNLIPSVLQRIAASRPVVWWKRSWFEWHPVFQSASAVLFCGVFAAAYWFQDALGLMAQQWFSIWTEHSPFLKASLAIGESFLSVGQYLFDSIKTPYFMIAGGVALGLYLAVIAIGGLFCRIASEQPLGGVNE